MKLQYGGTFAPPLTDSKLAEYKALAAVHAGTPVGAAMQTCLACCERWWDLPEPNGTATMKHPVGVGTIVSLQADHKAALDEHIPWPHELDAIQALFDGIDNETQKPLRNAAFHLLWHVRELNLDREPLTADKLQVATLPA